MVLKADLPLQLCACAHGVVERHFPLLVPSEGALWRNEGLQASFGSQAAACGACARRHWLFISRQHEIVPCLVVDRRTSCEEKKEHWQEKLVLRLHRRIDDPFRWTAPLDLWHLSFRSDGRATCRFALCHTSPPPLDSANPCSSTSGTEHPTCHRRRRAEFRLVWWSLSPVG